MWNWGPRGANENGFRKELASRGIGGNAVLIYIQHNLCDTRGLSRESSRLMSHFLNSGGFM